MVDMRTRSTAQTAHAAPEEAAIPVVPWLDERTASLVRAIVAFVARDHPNLRAAFLYGSGARPEERPLHDAEPSDVDVFLLFDPLPGGTRLPVAQRLAISESIGCALDRHPDAPREVQTQYAVGDLAEWDLTFVENVAHDAILLWARDPLPTPLAAVAARGLRV